VIVKIATTINGILGLILYLLMAAFIVYLLLRLVVPFL
jgi:hypothetical protein